MAWQHMAHTGSLPPIWDLLDLQPSTETLHLLNLVEFTDLLNAFVILRVVATAHYLHLKSQELHEALREAHVTIGEEADERVGLREEIPACDIAARTVLLYVLLCLTYMYCTLYILYILHTVHIVHVSQFPSFPCLSDV
jgi:hypothetical protein